MRFMAFAFALLLSACGKETSSEIDWVSLPGGCFEMGSDIAYPEERPAKNVCVDPFEMTQTEITNRQFDLFVKETGYITTAEKGNPSEGVPAGSAIFEPKPGGAELSWWQFNTDASWRFPFGEKDKAAHPTHPVVHISYPDAEAYAVWIGGRLPKEEEWEFAAQPSHSHQKGPKKSEANIWTGLFPIINTADDGFEGVAPVGVYPPNSYGLHDMIGNVWEWTSSPYTPSHAQNDRDLAGPNGLDFDQPGVSVGTIKGGSFLCSANYCARFRPSARQPQDLTLSTSHIGFRVVRSSRL